MYSFLFIFSTVITILIFLLGAFIYFHNKNSFVNKIFFGFCFCTVFWTESVLLRFNLTDYKSILIATRLSYVAAALIGFMVYVFGYYFPKKNKYKAPFIPLIFITFIVVTLCLTPYILKNLVISDTGNQENIFGPLFWVYMIYFPVIVLWGFYNLILKRNDVTKEEWSQSKIILIGILFSFIVGVSTNLFIPNFLNTSLTEPYGPLSITFLVSFTAYAIIKHQFMNVKVIAIEIFASLISILILIDALLTKTRTEFALKFSLFIFVAFFSYLLIRGVMAEIRAKEQIAKISEDLRIANIELKKLDQTKSEFLSIASHQLRTPLTAIKGYSSLILEGEFGKITDAMKDVVSKIFESSQQLVKMVEDFLNISRIESGRLKYDFSTFDVRKIVENLVKDFKTNDEKAKKLSLEFFSEEGDFNISADQNKITQVISNLIDNSIKYTLEGFVKIYLSKPEENKIQIKVGDSGVGISKETMPGLFQKFSRLDGSRHLYTGGSGLGLYVAKKIIDDHGGRIWAESQGEGKGSTFFVELPVG